MRDAFKELLRLSSIYMLGTISERAILFIFLPVLTAYLSPVEFGLVTLGTLSSTLCIKLTAPFTVSLNRYYYNPDYIGQRSVLLWNLFYLSCVKALILHLFFLGFSGAIASLIGGNVKSAVTMIQLFSVSVLLIPVESYFKAYVRLEQKAQFYVVVSIFQVALFCAALLLLLIYLENPILSVPLAISIRSAAGVLLILPVFLSKASFKFQLSIVKEPLAYGYPLILSAYSNYLIQSADKIILRIFYPLGIVGIYDVGYRLSSVIDFLFVTPVKQALLPIAFQQEDQPDQQKYFLARSATVYYTAALMIGLLISLYAKEAVSLLARQAGYQSAWIVVPFIVFSYIQHGLGNHLGLGLVMRKKSTLQSLFLFIGALVNIAFNFLLIPRYGLLGAAVATVISYLVWNLLKGVASYVYYGIGFEYTRFCWLTLFWAGFVAAGNLPTGFSPFLLFGYKLLLLAGFPSLIFFGGFLKPDEKALVLAPLRKGAGKLFSRDVGG
jgi:O-antigen/teichoic acid export membrane protein